MKKVFATSLALIMLLTAACGVTATPVTGTDAPAETPLPAGFDVITPVEGEDYTLSRHEISGTYSYIHYSPIMRCLDEQAMKSGSHYAAYTVSSGELVELERRTFSQDYEFDGAVRHIEFEWCEYGEGVAITYLDPHIAHNNAFDIYSNRFYSTSPESFMICFRKSDGTVYPVIADLYTGEISDVLAGAAPEHIRSADMPPDGKSMVLGCRESTEAPIIRWYCDLETGKLTDITGITPEYPGAYCEPAGDGIISFYSRETPENTYYELNRLWRTDINTGELEMLCASAAAPYAEFHYDRTYSRYMLVSQNGYLVSIDIASGASAPISPDVSPYQVRYSPDGTKALLMSYDGATVSALSLVDFEARTVAEYPVPEGFNASANVYAEPCINWLGSGAFALDNGSDGVGSALQVWVYELGTPSAPSVDPVDYGFTTEQLSGPELPDFAALELEALGAYYLSSDGAPSEGAAEELTRRFISAPEDVFGYLLALGGTPAPHFPDETAAEHIALGIASHAAWDCGELGEGFPAAIASVSGTDGAQGLAQLMSDRFSAARGGSYSTWVYPETACYRSGETRIAIEFPESWTGHLALLETRGPEPSVVVCCREVAEAELAQSGTIEYAVIFAVLSADRNDAAALRNFSDPECFTILGERGRLVYYYSNARGRIKGAELWHRDIWDANRELLSGMAASCDRMIDRVEIL